MKKTEIDETSKDNNTSAEAKSTASGSMKKVKYGSMSLVTIAFVIAIVVLLNIMASYMVKRAPLKIDLTADKRYELSDESIDFLRDKLDKDVDIVVTCQKDDFENIAKSIEDYMKYYYYMYYGTETEVDCPFDMIPILLEKYQMYANQGSGSISVKYVDLDKDPTAVKKYSDAYGSDIGNQSIVVACGDRVRVIDSGSVGGMIVPDFTDPSGIKLSFAGESTITSEIMNVTDAHPIMVAFAATADGRPIYNTQAYADSVAGLRDQLLTKNGYFCTDVDLSTDELDAEKYDMIVIPMPEVDFDPAVIEKLNNFLYNDGQYGKKMLYFSSAMTSNIPNITEFLADWSIGVNENSVVVDQEKSMENNYFVIQVKQADTEEAGEKVSGGSLKCAAGIAQEVLQLNNNNEAVTAEILKTYSSAFNVDIATNEQKDSGSEKSIGVVARKRKQIGNKLDDYKIVESNVMVIGCGTITSSKYLVQTNLYSNTRVLLNAINKMTGKETDTVIIPDKALQQAVIAPTSSQTKSIRIIVIYIIPALVAAIGLVVLLRRKNR
ncbi:MAG: GldG family protein [Ruminococcus sp.]|nr:GldG family protein [Ruminococcus sp.]